MKSNKACIICNSLMFYDLPIVRSESLTTLYYQCMRCYNFTFNVDINTEELVYYNVYLAKYSITGSKSNNSTAVIPLKTGSILFIKYYPMSWSSKLYDYQKLESKIDKLINFQ